MVNSAISVLSAITLTAHAVAGDPIITPPPDLSRRQAASTSGGLIGYVELGGYWTALSCNANYTFSEWQSWGECCYTNTPACDFVTSCNGNTMYGEVAYTTCQYGCRTVSVYDYLNAPSPVTVYGCLNWEGTMYRNTFSTTAGFQTSTVSNGQSAPAPSSQASTTSRPSLGSSSSSEQTLSNFVGNPTTSPTTQSPSSVVTPQPATTSSPSTSTKSNAWIAGAVIGPVFGAIILGLAFWVYRLHQRKSRDQQNQAVTGKSHGGVGYDPAVSSMPEAPVQDPLYSRTEMSANRPPAELPTTSHPPGLGYFGESQR